MIWIASPKISLTHGCDWCWCVCPFLLFSAGFEVTCRCFLWCKSLPVWSDFLPAGQYQFGAYVLRQTDGTHIDTAFVSAFMISLSHICDKTSALSTLGKAVAMLAATKKGCSVEHKYAIRIRNMADIYGIPSLRLKLLNMLNLWWDEVTGYKTKPGAAFLNPSVVFDVCLSPFTVARPSFYQLGETSRWCF